MGRLSISARALCEDRESWDEGVASDRLAINDQAVLRNQLDRNPILGKRRSTTGVKDKSYRTKAYLRQNDLGIAVGEAGMMRIAPGLVRIPDLSFINWDGDRYGSCE